MENNPDFHGKTANEDQLKEAIKEINSNWVEICLQVQQENMLEKKY